MVEVFIATGDRVKSVLAAYNCKSPEVACVNSYE
jgi:hypothetical protein